MKTQLYTAQLYCDISGALQQGTRVAFGSMANGGIIFVVAIKELEYRTKNAAGASFAQMTTARGQDYEVFVCEGENVRKLAEIKNESFNIHFVQLLPDGRILLACARSHYVLGKKRGLNGRIYDAEGSFVRGILLGDGIEDIQVTANGVIWTSYFDEGIWGNYDGEDPVGISGLRAWTAQGEEVYSYRPLEWMDIISDCYALNVAPDGATWCYYYTDFPLVRIVGGQITGSWDMPVHGSHCFAVSQDHALFRGGYNEGDLFYLIRLEEKHVAQKVKKISLQNIGKIEAVSARGEAVFLLSDRKVYRLTVAELL